MPATRIKNSLYRIMLPFLSPSCGSHPVSSVSGHELVRYHEFVHLLRRHHVLGSAVLLSSGQDSSLICTSSEHPCHQADSDTFFRVASITKMATALLCMRLADLHILDLDLPVKNYFYFTVDCPSFEKITLFHLLSHTSGLIDPPGLESALQNQVPFTEFLPSALRFVPGSSFHYSNFGYGLIGCVMESVLKKPVSVIFRELLFNPLHMNSTLEGCSLPSDKIMPVTRILPYHKGNDMILTPLGSRPLTEPDSLRHYGHTAGSMYTDILSLDRLLNVFIRNHDHFISDHSVKRMCMEHATYGNLSPTLSYGLGLLRIRDASLSDSLILGHQGFAYGCADGAFWEEKTGRVVIMLNGGSSEARTGRLGLLNRDLLRWALRKELPLW